MEADWKFPEEVPGWLTLKEGTALASLAKGKEVLEIGTYCGRSTICMAQTAAGVDTIDHHKGDPGTINAEVPQPVADSHDELIKHLDKYDLEDKVMVFVGPSSVVCPKLKDASYDLVFIDGGHDTPSVHHDTQQALRLVKPGGVIAYHDWTYPSVQDGAALGGLGTRVGRALVPDGEADSLVWFRLPLVPVSQEVVEVQKICALAMPIYPTGAVIGPVVRLLQNPARTVACVALQGQGSLLANCFNMLWCRALNARKQEPRLRYFAMLHADVEPQMPFWLDVLLHELESNQADMVSAVVPIKTRQGLTSTAIGDSFDPWCPVRRLTMKEVFELPETFSAADVRTLLGPDKVGFGPLLVNTGCFVIRLDQEWSERVFFTIRDRLVKLPDGTIAPEVEPEDWHLSRLLERNGCRVLATRKVPLWHHGTSQYSNDEAWGDQSDEATVAYLKQKRAAWAY